MFAMHEQLARVRAIRLLDMAQATAYPNMRAHDRKSWIDGLLTAARGVVTDVGQVAEQVYVNRKPVGLRSLKRAVGEVFGKAMGG